MQREGKLGRRLGVPVQQCTCFLSKNRFTENAVHKGYFVIIQNPLVGLRLGLYNDCTSYDVFWYPYYTVQITPDVPTGDNWEDEISSSPLPSKHFLEKQTASQWHTSVRNYCAIQHASIHHCRQLTRKMLVFILRYTNIKAATCKLQRCVKS
jgi:hypothetical protein